MDDTRNINQKARVNIKMQPEIRDGLKKLAKAKGFTYVTEYLAHIAKDYIKKVRV